MGLIDIYWCARRRSDMNGVGEDVNIQAVKKDTKLYRPCKRYQVA